VPHPLSPRWGSGHGGGAGTQGWRPGYVPPRLAALGVGLPWLAAQPDHDPRFEEGRPPPFVGSPVVVGSGVPGLKPRAAFLRAFGADAHASERQTFRLLCVGHSSGSVQSTDRLSDIVMPLFGTLNGLLPSLEHCSLHRTELKRRYHTVQCTERRSNIVRVSRRDLFITCPYRATRTS